MRLTLTSNRARTDTLQSDDETALLIDVGEKQSRGAYERLYAIMFRRLTGHLINQGRPADESENITQEVMLTVWRKAGLFDPSKSSARTWMFAILRNRLIDRQRAIRREAARNDAYEREPTREQSTNGGLMQETARDRLATLLAELDPDVAQVVIMSYLEGKSHGEIARETGVPLGTVKSRIRLGFRHLQEKVSQ
jgi:RNA polymerase sigma-70 factor (ECF subfamily)